MNFYSAMAGGGYFSYVVALGAMAAGSSAWTLDGDTPWVLPPELRVPSELMSDELAEIRWLLFF